MATFNIPALLSQVFGILPRTLELPPDTARELPAFPGVAVAKADTAGLDIAPSGAPWVEPFNLGAATDWRGRAFGGLQLPATTMADCTRRKTVMQTAVTGRDGSVKELVAAEDWRIRFRGILISADGTTPPHAEAHEVKEMAAFQGAIPVEGRLLRALGIDFIVVEALTIHQIAGTPGALAFELECVQDTAPEIAIMEES